MTMPKEMKPLTVVVAKHRVTEMKVLSRMHRVQFSQYTATPTAPPRANGRASSNSESQLDSISWCLDNSFPEWLASFCRGFVNVDVAGGQSRRESARLVAGGCCAIPLSILIGS